MIEVTAQKITTVPQYQLHSQTVQLHGFDKLTPRAARAALEIAFGSIDKGIVWAENYEYGYKVYPNSARKVHSDGILGVV